MTRRRRLCRHSRALGRCAYDRVLRAEVFWVPQWFRNTHNIAYYDMYRYPDTLPPYALGVLDFWWLDQDAYARLKAEGAF